MAIILEFRRTEDVTARAGRPVEGALGEIIIFPGVRIERQVPSDSGPQADAGTGGHRTHAKSGV